MAKRRKISRMDAPFIAVITAEGHNEAITVVAVIQLRKRGFSVKLVPAGGGIDMIGRYNFRFEEDMSMQNLLATPHLITYVVYTGYNLTPVENVMAATQHSIWMVMNHLATDPRLPTQKVVIPEDDGLIQFFQTVPIQE